MATTEQVADQPLPKDAASGVEDPAVERIRVLRESGWGSRVRFYQPRNLAFWVFLTLVVAGAFVMLPPFADASVEYGTPLQLAIVAFVLYGALFWWFTQRIDRYARLPRILPALAFLWGGFGATLMASFANTPILSLWAKAFGVSWAGDWGAGLTAPFNEEVAKGIGLLLLIALAGRAVATAYDGFILGAFIGLGFQILEDINYAVGAAGAGFGADPAGYEIQVVQLRTILGIGAHILYSAIFCAGLVYLLGRPGQRRRVGAGLGLMLTAMVLHGIWDSLGGILGPGIRLIVVAWAVVIAVKIVIVIRVFKMTVPAERAYMRAVIAPEVAAGTVTEEEAATLAGDRKARKAYHQSKKDRHRRRDILLAAHDLANELAAANGEDTSRVRFARQELARIRSGAGAPRRSATTDSG